MAISQVPASLFRSIHQFTGAHMHTAQYCTALPPPPPPPPPPPTLTIMVWMPRIINISGTCPAQMMPRNEPISTNVDTVRTRNDR